MCRLTCLGEYTDNKVSLLKHTVALVHAHDLVCACSIFFRHLVRSSFQANNLSAKRFNNLATSSTNIAEPNNCHGLVTDKLHLFLGPVVLTLNLLEVGNVLSVEKHTKCNEFSKHSRKSSLDIGEWNWGIDKIKSWSVRVNSCR